MKKQKRDPYFLGELILRFPFGNPRNAEIVKHFAYTDNHGHRYECEPGDIINGASIPRIFWRLVGSPYTGNYRRAAALHDCEYHRGRHPRKRIDKMFLAVMKHDGVGRIKRNVMYRAVRLCAGQFYGGTCALDTSDPA